MQLTLSERAAIIGILPQQSDFITMARIEEARKDLIPTEEEMKEVGAFEGADKNIYWNSEKDTPKEIALGETVTDQIVRKLRDMNEQKTLEAKHISLWKKFVEPAVEKLDEKPETAED